MRLATRCIACGIAWIAAAFHPAAAIDFRQLMFLGASAYDEGFGEPAWSPDGTRIAFTHAWIDPGHWYFLFSSVIILQVSNGAGIPFESQSMTTCGEAPIRCPAWSPDGDHIAFTCGLLWIGTIGEPSATQLDGAYGQNPTWSPDGTRIAYDDFNGIYVVSVVGGGPTWLTTDGCCPAWSPDGDWIAYSSRRSGSWDIWLVSASGGEPRPLTENPASDQHPSWSPDGELIAFDSDRSGNTDVWVVRVTNRALSRVTDDPAYDGEPDWSHDGSQIAFISTRSGYTNLWVASDLRTVGVQQTSWGAVKKLYR